MSKIRVRYLKGVCLIIALPLLASGQDIVEHSLLTGHVSTSAAGAGKGVSKSIGGVFGSLDRVLGGQKSGDASTSPSEVISVSVDRQREVYTPTPVSPLQVEVGMDRELILKQFGKPFMRTARAEGPELIEVFIYPNPNGDMTVLTLREGKVTAVSPTPARASL